MISDDSYDSYGYDSYYDYNYEGYAPRGGRGKRRGASNVGDISNTIFTCLFMINLLSYSEPGNIIAKILHHHFDEFLYRVRTVLESL